MAARVAVAAQVSPVRDMMAAQVSLVAVAAQAEIRPTVTVAMAYRAASQAQQHTMRAVAVVAALTLTELNIRAV
jgi:hypothetical protein